MARITSPGKFEGEAEYVPHFWDVSLDGTPDTIEVDGETVYRIEVVDTDRAIYPELAERSHVYLFEDEQGFVREIDAMIAESRQAS